MSPGDPLSLAGTVATILDRLGIRYVIGGSVASSIWGEPRATIDLDLMIDADDHAVSLLVEELRDEFYVDEETAAFAVAREGSFNAIHYASSMKVDFFIAERAPLARTQLERRRGIPIGEDVLQFYAPEDLLIRKLMWYRLGGEQSERQWRDVLGILRVSWTRMERDYLAAAAEQANVSDLLEQATLESGEE
jgi:hypothetical protein